jgi:putative transposase
LERLLEVRSNNFRIHVTDVLAMFDAPPQGPVRGQPQLTLGALDMRFRTFVLDVYHARPHSETHVPPQQRWEAGGFLPQMPDSLEQLDLLLLTVTKPRKVRRDGLWFLGMRYMDPTLGYGQE